MYVLIDGFFAESATHPLAPVAARAIKGNEDVL